MESAAVAAWSSILRTQALLLPRLERAVNAATGMSLTHYDVLLELSAAGGRLTMGQLGDRVVLSRSRVSRVVDDLVAIGLVTREVNDHDRRSAYAVLSPEGRTRFRAAAKVYLPAIERELSGVDEKVLRQISQGLNSVIDAAQ